MKVFEWLTPSPQNRVTAPDTLTGADELLLARCQAGDEQAWTQFFELHHDFVRRTARRLGTPSLELDDAVQESFTVAFRQLGRFEKGRVRTWLFRLVSNVTSNRHRARRVRESFLALFVAQPPPPTPSAEGAWESHEAAQLVSRVLARLSPKKREVFALFELEGLPGDEIAELVGCSVATVWTRLHHARKDFARLVKTEVDLP